MMNEQTIILLSSLGMAVIADKSCFCVSLLLWCLLFGGTAKPEQNGGESSFLKCSPPAGIHGRKVL